MGTERLCKTKDEEEDGGDETHGEGKKDTD